MLILNSLSIYPEKEIQEALELCSARLQNEGGLSRKKPQNYLICLSEIRIGTGKK